MIRYKTSEATLGIAKVEVERETRKFIVLKGGRRVARFCEEYQYHTTFADARRFLVESEESNIARMKDVLRFQEEQIRRSQLLLDKYSNLSEASSE